MKSSGLAVLLRTLEKNGISDRRVLDAIAHTPRDAFISDPDLLPQAYADEALPIECGQTISQPYIVAYMTERLHVMPVNDVLEIGTGSGYQAAILSRLARRVFTIESHPELRGLAALRFQRLGLQNITAIHGDGTKGWPDFRFFERIIVTACADELPQKLAGQLAQGGFMVIPLGSPGDQRITLITREADRLDAQPLLQVRFVPLVAHRE
jgi:protein-L-isoaspartate(D-aspartate) O-methyltransferase